MLSIRTREDKHRRLPGGGSSPCVKPPMYRVGLEKENAKTTTRNQTKLNQTKPNQTRVNQKNQTKQRQQDSNKTARNKKKKTRDRNVTRSLQR